MTDKKILVLDIDGTLVNSEKKITPETLKYLKMIQEQGITRFRLLFQGNRSRSEVVATFLAVLELCRARVLHLAGSETDCTVRQEGEVPEHLTS